jgi:carbamoyltransferase
MYILGINAYHGDVSTVLLEDGDVVAAVEEERFERIKHVAGFPSHAIQCCLDIAGIEGRDVDVAAIGRDPSANLGKKVRFAVKNPPSPKLVWDRLMNWNKILNIKTPLADSLGVPKSDLPELHRIEHHPAHLASAFFVSPFDEAAVCSIDAMGDFTSTSMAIGTGNQMEILDRVHYPHSLGILYTAITQHLGFPYFGDEYKVMGMAPYGEKKYLDELCSLVQLRGDGGFELNLDYFRHWKERYDAETNFGVPSLGKLYTPELERLLGPERDPDEELTDRHLNIARSLQAIHEECVFHILRNLQEKTEESRLCLAGGCAMNSVANGKVRANTPFEEVYIQPAAGDNGIALGAAYYVWNEIEDQPRTFHMDHVFWGPEYDAKDVPTLVSQEKEAARRYKWTRYDEVNDLCEKTAQLIADGNVIGWFRGRLEWGARALGNRSILADPRRADTRDRINNRVKYREEFRPFAPSILKEAVDEYFVDAAPDPFMQQVYPVREEKRDEIPAVTHVDGTGRLQAVFEETNPVYYRLIEAFADVTGVPVVLNTSFNENEPIVNTPEEALNCFFRTDMDAVVIEDTLVQRQTATVGEKNAPHK